MIGFKLFVQVLCSHSLKCQLKIGKHRVKEESCKLNTDHEKTANTVGVSSIKKRSKIDRLTK